MSHIYTWIRNIACFLCVFQMILHLVPGNSYKRYVRFVGGILLIILVMSPVAGVLNVSGSFEKALRIEGIKEEIENIRTEREGLEALKSDKVWQAFEDEIKRQIEAMVEAYGYEPVQSRFSFQKKEGSVVGIEEIWLVISRKNSRIKIQVGEETEKEKEIEIEQLKKEIQEVYQIPMEHINMDVRE